jgi:hypothetical protein
MTEKTALANDWGSFREVSLQTPLQYIKGGFVDVTRKAYLVARVSNSSQLLYHVHITKRSSTVHHLIKNAPQGPHVRSLHGGYDRTEQKCQRLTQNGLNALLGVAYPATLDLPLALCN